MNRIYSMAPITCIALIKGGEDITKEKLLQLQQMIVRAAKSKTISLN